MLTKRALVSAGLAGAGLWSLEGRRAAAQEPTFDQLYQQALADATLADGRRADTDDKSDDFATRAIAPRVRPSDLSISDDAFRLIELFEVTSEKLYTARYQRPLWPGGESGVTIGVGYDLGYAKPAWLAEDWNTRLEPNVTARLDPKVIARLTPLCGVRGQEAKRVYKSYQDVLVPWAVANPQFRRRLIPMYTGLTLSRLPKSAQNLHPDCLGALVSLVYNRGAPFNSDKPRFKEMRQIRGRLEDNELDQIPSDILAMCRLWKGKKGLEGLVRRRQLEAALFRQGFAKMSHV